MTPNRSSVRGAFVAAALLSLAACLGNTTTEVVNVAPTPPAISTQPIALVVYVGDTLLLQVGVTGATPLTYQWYHDSLAITGGTKDTLRVLNSTFADSGDYYVGVTNVAGTVSSNSVHVSLRPKVSTTAWWQDGGAAATTARDYSSAANDESAVLVENAGELTLNEPNVSKIGATSSPSLSRSRGADAAILAAGGSRIYINTGVLTDNADSTDAIFATGAGTSIAISGGEISTVAHGSAVLGLSNGAAISVAGGSLTSQFGDAISVVAASATDAPVSITLTAGANLAGGTGVLLRLANHASGSLTLDGETIAGAVASDATSSATVSLVNSTNWSGSAQGVAVALDATSVWALTANSVVTALTGAAISGASITNIQGNGLTVTYDRTLAANAALGGKSYTLAGGGQLAPR
jgi:hypothetical protein